ncbi:carboxypeptidase B [Nilaparvata lugens]|uniref:carboxypeptidase B n=1 Tax=Nilaparvata lugens TaxID=108931 RepID=UPI00193EAE60|nr:carboxypeptidase B [Nilaparvata lugens]
MKLLVLLICISSILKGTVALEFGEVSSRISRPIYSPDDFLELFKYSSGFAWDHYPSFDEINDFIDYLGETYSDFVTVYLAGCSGEGRPIKVVHVKSGNCSANRIWIDGGIHGREWVTPSAVLLILFQLVERRESNSETIRGVDFFVCPIINPDGYEYSREFSNYWRKNRRKTETGCVGVDLNRNWIYQPEHRNTSGESCQELYPGPRPFSEPETQAIKTFLDQNRVNFKAFLTFHTYGQMIMYPYGYKAELPEDHDDLQRLATHIVQNISYHGGPQYKVVNTYNHSGFSVGGLDDYAKEVLGIKYTYTVELRDTGTYIFFLPRRLILPTSIDALVVAMTVAEQVSPM